MDFPNPSPLQLDPCGFLKLQNDEGIVFPEEKSFKPTLPPIEITERDQVLVNKTRKTRKYLGLALTLLSGTLYSLAALIVKLLGNYHPFVIAVWRFQGILWPAIAIVLYEIFYKKNHVFDSVWPLKDKEKRRAFQILMLRGGVGFWSVVLQFYSLNYLNVADSMVITSSTSVFVTLFAHCFIGEKCALIPIITAVLTFAGVFVISRPPILTGQEAFDTDILMGVSMALGCMFINAANLVIQRYLRDAHFSLISLSSGVWGTVESIVLSFALNVFEFPESSKETGYAGCLALVTFCAQTSIVVALKHEEAGPVAVVQSCDVIFAFLWQFIFLGEKPNEFSLIGSFIIVLGLLVTAVRKCVSSLPPEHKNRKRLRFLLL